MKMVKRTLALALLIVAMMSVLIIPASAATVNEPWVGRFGGFRMTSEYNYITEYACTVQSILWGNSGTKSIIEESGKVDGLFGSGTTRAVKTFQKNMNFPVKEQDGIVGPDTWKAMARSMQIDGYNWFHSGDRIALGAHVLDGLCKFYYFDTFGAPSKHFHTCYA